MMSMCVEIKPSTRRAGLIIQIYNINNITLNLKYQLFRLHATLKTTFI